MKSVNFVIWLLIFQITAIFCKPGNFNIFGAIHHNRDVHWNVNFYEKLASESSSPQVPGPHSTPECADVTKSNEDNCFLTKFEEQQIISGTEIDLRFNETRDENDPTNKLISSPGCPFSSPIFGRISHPMNQNIWVHYGNPPKCFLVGTKGPCPDGSKLAAQRNSPQGICRCACDFKSFPIPELEDGKFVKEINDPFLDTVGPYCFNGFEHHAMYANQCYKILTQGPCDSSEAFVVDFTSNTPTCKERECCTNTTESPNEISSFEFYFNSTCQAVGTQCFNSSDEDPTHTYSLDVRQNVPFPSCFLNDRLSSPQSFAFNLQSLEICAKNGLKYSNYLNTCISVSRFGKNVG